MVRPQDHILEAFKYSLVIFGNIDFHPCQQLWVDFSNYQKNNGELR